MFWIGFAAGLLTPGVAFLLWLLCTWMLNRNLAIQCPCGANFGVLPDSVGPGTFNIATEWKHRWHRWFRCPRRKAVNSWL